MKVRLEYGHRVGFDVEADKGERTLAREAVQIPLHEHVIEDNRIGDEDGATGQRLEPCDIIWQRSLWRLQVLAARVPCVGLRLPPQHRFGMAACAGQRFEIGSERADERLVGQISGRSETEHGVRPRYRPISLDIGADVDLDHAGCSEMICARGRKKFNRKGCEEGRKERKADLRFQVSDLRSINSLRPYAVLLRVLCG